jgi:hypothetical protein
VWSFKPSATTGLEQRMKSRHYNKKDLKFARRTVKEADSKLVIQMAIDEKARNAGYISDYNNALLSRRYERKCYAVDRLKWISAFVR